MPTDVAWRDDADQDYSARALPLEPTEARPGSEAKVRVMRRRRRHSQALWHPDDPVEYERIANCNEQHGNNVPAVGDAVDMDGIETNEQGPLLSDGDLAELVRRRERVARPPLVEG